MALTADRDTKRREGVIARYPVAANGKIYRGGMVCLNASGYAVAAADTANYKFVGIAMESIDNTGGSNGDKYVKVWRKGVFKLKKASPALTDIGVSFYVKDDEEVQTAANATNDVLVGVCIDIDSDAGEIWVEIG